MQALREHDPALRLIFGGQGVPGCCGMRAPSTRPTPNELAAYAELGLHPPPTGELPAQSPAAGRGSVTTSAYLDANSGFAANFTQVTAAADAARGYARRAIALERIALRDPMTELWNWRAFEDRHHALTAGGITTPPAILMIDVDTFKAIQRSPRPRRGDRVLLGVARCITSAIRDSDFAARYGGDEFVVLLPDTPLQLAAEVGERIRSRIERELTDPQITVSVGVSAPDHSAQRRCALDVDNALYKAKERGRNQVAVASVLPPKVPSHSRCDRTSGWKPQYTKEGRARVHLHVPPAAR